VGIVGSIHGVILHVQLQCEKLFGMVEY